MPEGHTIHRAARDHARALGGQRLAVSSPQGRFDVESIADASGHARLVGVEAYGKHLFYTFEGPHVVHVHLGLFGRFFRRRTPAPPPRGSTRLRLEGETLTVDLIGPTACEVVSADERAAILARLGPDPLREDADPRAFYERLARSRAPIGAVLLDQQVVAGVGNVYRAEVLHLLGVHPDTPARALPRETVRELWRLVVGLLRRGVEERAIVTTRGLELSSPRARVPRGERTHVYGRRVCRSCGGAVLTQTMRARVAHFCPVCQPRVDVDDAPADAGPPAGEACGRERRAARRRRATSPASPAAARAQRRHLDETGTPDA